MIGLQIQFPDPLKGMVVRTAHVKVPSAAVVMAAAVVMIVMTRKGMLKVLLVRMLS